MIDAFVDELDLRDLGFKPAEKTGRPGYHPLELLKLYIYGYLNRVQSSRRLERETLRNVEVMWLLGRLVPDHKTIAGFRKDNGEAIRKVCAQFVELCREIGLLAVASVAIDGSKFKAVNNRDHNFTRAKMQRRKDQIAKSVTRYLEQLDSTDRQESSPAKDARKTRLAEKITKLREEMQRLKVLEKQMEASPDQQVSLTDPDSRSIATSGRGSGVVGYNTQAAVDTEHHLIVAHEVTNKGNDSTQLADMAKIAKQVLGTQDLDVVADRGYFSSTEILACDQAGITVTLPKPMTCNAKASGRFGKQDFRYVSDKDVYICPAGNRLWTELNKMGLPIICIDARHAKAALKMQINKSDRNDAIGIARIMQTGWYREVRVKDLDSHAIKGLLASRALLVKIRRDIENQIRGLLKNLGLVIGRAKRNPFTARAKELIDGNPALTASVAPLLEARKTIIQQIADLDRKVLRLARHDAQVQRS